LQKCSSSEPIIDETIKLFLEIEELISLTIPNEVKNLIISENYLVNSIDLFHGYSLENLDSLLNHYRNMCQRNSCSFFGYGLVNENFMTSENFPLGYYDEATECDHYSEGDEIQDLRGIIPLFNGGSGFYIVMNLCGPKPGELLVVGQDNLFSVLAPSLTEHFKDLIIGLESGCYRIDGESNYQNVVYPISWGQRELVQSGECYINEDEEVVKR
jgi:hypothetical protein